MTQPRWYKKLHYQIFVMMGLGVAIGLPLNLLAERGILERETVLRVAGVGESFGKLFLALLSMVVVPLIFSSLASSIVGLTLYPIDLPDGLETKLFTFYQELRLDRDSGFDRQVFETAYAVFGAQRATKILGIFARLYVRDGKPGYLQHISRVSAALERNLRHPALGDLAQWYRAHLPAAERQAGNLP